MERVVSLLPSTTEIACALGCEALLVGRSHECDYPLSVARLPSLTEAKLDAGESSRRIDDRVRQLVRDGLSIYRVDAERMRELAPTLILTQDQCEVCAASLDDVEEALRDWIGARPRIVSLRPKTLEDVWRDIETVASALGVARRGREVGEEARRRVSQLATAPRDESLRPRVAVVEWIDPLMGAGNWMPELVTLAGGRHLFGEIGAHSPGLAWEVLRAADPDVIIVVPCGFDLARTRAEMGPLLAQPGWSELSAVRDERVFLADGNQFFNRPGPRLIESLAILSEILAPKLSPPRFRGSAWEPL